MADSSVAELPAAAGHFDQLELASPGRLLIRGWILSPRRRLDSVEAYWNGQLVQREALEERPDVAVAYPAIKHAGRTGFRFYLKTGGQIGRLDLIGCDRGLRRVRMSLALRRRLEEIPLPPAALTERVASSSGDYFKIQGIRIYTDLMDALARRAPLAPGQTVLDWGCGCGRLTVHLLDDESRPEVHGCDIDGEAIDWCRRNLRDGRFQRIAAEPPTDYADNTFDVVVGVSVFTHLSERDQIRWLEELRRIIRPGGVLLASVHSAEPGEAGTRQGRLRGLLRSWLGPDRRPRWIDRGANPQLESVAPSGYYRDVAQSRAYTLETWGRYFQTLDYVENGVNGLQDLVVARTPRR
jgi:SAM-dependent methyltransferase